jgi:hypothetical protein
MTKKLSLRKAQGAAYDAATMTRFLAVLEAWCNHLARRGYTIRPDADPLPGTMRWFAERE